MNAQDVLRDVHDPSLHALKTTASLSASTVYVGNPTLYAVVNTGAAVDSTVNIGFATVAVSTPTLYAVVNTSAAGVGNSIVTVANPNVGILGNVTLTDGKTYIGLTTATIGSMPSVLSSGQYFPAPQSVVSGALAPLAVDATGQLLLGRTPNYIGLASVNIGGTLPALSASPAFIGIVTVANSQANTGNVTLNASPNQIGSVTVSNPVSLGAGVAGIGFATVAVSTPTLFAVVNTAAAGVGNSIVTVANPNFGINVGVNYIGLTTSTLDINKVMGSAANVTVNSGVPLLAVRKDNGISVFTDTNNDFSPIAVDSRGALNFQLVNNSGNRAAFNTNEDALKVMIVDHAGDAVALDGSGDPLRVSAIGNVTLSDAKTYIGLTTTTLGSGLSGIGFATVAVSTPTLFAVVNTSAAGVGNSIVTVANPNFGINAGVNNIGFMTITLDNLRKVYPLLDNDTNFAALNMDSDGMNQSANYVAVANHPLVHNGSSVDRARSANIANATTGIGVPASGILGFDSTNYRRILTDTSGRVKLGDPNGYIGLVTITGSLAAASGNVTITDGKTYIGLVTATLGTGLSNIGFSTVYLAAGNSNIGDVDVATVAAGANYIGLASVNIGGTLPALTASSANIGSVSILGGSVAATLQTSTLNIGSVSVLGGSLTANLNTGTLNIGSVSVLGGVIGLNAGVNGIGFATVKVDAGTQFIGLVTAVTRNAGTNKTLINLPVGFSASSIVTVAVPSSSNSIYITNAIFNSNATVRFTLKSGVTYLLGNASIGVTLNPGGGFPLTGSPDSPSWIGLPSGALVIEKLDLTATAAQIGGNVVYFQE